MTEKQTRQLTLYLALMAVLGWFALIAQLYLIIRHRVVSVLETIIRYFNFFTILTNLVVAIAVTVLLLNPNSRRGVWFAKSTTLTAITVYITIVGLVYNAILRFLWQPQGLQFVVDELLHTVIPALFILFWFLFVSKKELQYKQFLPWLIYPLVYIVYTALYGAITGYYPYPFVNVTQLGYTKVLMNTAWLLLAFAVLSLLFITVAKLMSRQRQ